jgi:hypothetical protein
MKFLTLCCSLLVLFRCLTDLSNIVDIFLKKTSILARALDETIFRIFVIILSHFVALPSYNIDLRWVWVC